MKPDKPTIPNPGGVPEISWAQVHARYMQNAGIADQVHAICRFDWGQLPIEDTGTNATGGSLVSEIMKRHPERFETADGHELQWESIEQRDMNANRLLGGLKYPFEYVRQAVERIEKQWEWSKGHIVVLPPAKLLGGRIMLQQEDGFVHGMIGALPPVESVGILRSKSLKKHDFASSLVVVWYQTCFGMDPYVIEQVRQLDWPSLAFSWSY